MRELKFVVGVALLWLTLGTAAASASAPPVYDFAFGSEELSSPAGLAMDGESGDIWVADEGNAVLQSFEPSGKFLNDLEFFGYPPTDVAVDSEGHIWATFGECCLVEFDGESGKSLKYNFSASSALGVAVDHEDNVWVTLATGVIQQYDSEAKLLSEFGEEGSEPGQFSYPLGIDGDWRQAVWTSGCRCRN